MKSMKILVLLACLGVLIFSCASREVREEYYHPSSYNNPNPYLDSWNDPYPSSLRGD